MEAGSVRFGAFELDLASGDLKKDGRAVKLPRQPSQLLVVLVQNAGSIVSRETIQEALWPDGTVVDYDQSINFGIKRIREALGDDPGRPRFVATVPRKGYRFLASVEPSAPVRAPGPSRVPLALAALSLVGLVYVVIRRSSPPPPTPVHLSVPLEPGQVLSTSNPLAISPDGSTVVFHSSGELHVRRIGDDGIDVIPDTVDAQNPFFAPDNDRIGFLQKGQLKTQSLTGGPPTIVCDVDSYIHGRWGDDGRILFSVSTVGPIYAVDAEGGTPQALTSVDSDSGEAGHAWPEPLPGGRGFLYSTLRGDEPSRIAVREYGSDVSRILVEDGLHPLYATSGHIVFSRGDALFAIDFELEELQTSGAARPVLTNLAASLNNSKFDLSRNGTLVYAPKDGDPTLRSELVWVDRTGRAELISKEPGPFFFPRLSPDEKRVLITVQPSAMHLFFVDLETGGMSRFRADIDSYAGNWSPDGRHIVFTSRHGLRTGQNLFLAAADGTGDVTRLTHHHLWEGVNSWSASGPMVFVRADVVGRRDLYLLSLEEPGEPVPLLTTPFFERAGALSPDARFLAYESDETGEQIVYVAALPRVTEKKPISEPGGTTPLWSKDGRELFYVQDDEMMVVDVTTEPELELSTPRALFQGHYVPGHGYGAHWANYDVTADGQRFVMLRSAEPSATATFDVVLNWHEVLRGSPETR